MGRIAFAKAGFVLLGVWFAVTRLVDTLEYLYWARPFSEGSEGWGELVYSVPLVALGVLIVFWSDTLARRTTGGGEEGASLRLADIQSTGIALLGLWLLVWNLPSALILLSKVPAIWRTWGTGEGAEFTRGSIYFQSIALGLLSSATGLFLMLRSRSFAASWAKRLPDVSFRPSVDVRGEPQRRGELVHLQAVVLTVLGLYFVADALPKIVYLGMIYEDLHSSSDETLAEQHAWRTQASIVAELLRAAIGVTIFFVARRLAGRTIVTSSASKPS